MPTFIEGDEKLGAADFETEIQVDAISKILYYATTIDREFDHAYKTQRVPGHKPWEWWIPMLASDIYRYGPFTFQEVEKKYDQAFKTWTLETVWAELQRKYKIWDDCPLQPR